MKKLLLTLAAMLMCIAASAIPADPTPGTVVQSDGTELTLRLIGDEFFHYYTTTDGYTVVRNAAGGYEYAQLQGKQLVGSGVLAHNVDQRSGGERNLLSTLKTHLTEPASTTRAEQKRAQRNQRIAREPLFDYSAFRGLIILINYNDMPFRINDLTGMTTLDFYQDMVNKPNYTGFPLYVNGRRTNAQCVGSMRDYYYDNSMGQFDPHFDIVEVDVDYSVEYPQGTSYADEVFAAAVTAADEQVNFADYDLDGDGMVDMVYFIVAGYSANYSGNNQNYLWPHMSYLYGYDEEQGWFLYEFDGVSIGRYASSTEMYGWENYSTPMPLGIGTMTHEFSHVLGLPDLYDTDYGSGGGQSNDPGEWDVMAGGTFNYGRVPAGYSIWERYALGFAQPEEISGVGEYSLTSVDKSNHGYILRTPVNKEFFMLENRQKNKWDQFLPGHGMLIARVDSTNQNVWDRNRVNADPKHNYYEIVRAGNGSSASDSDPFPGSKHVTSITSLSSPALVTWNGTPNDYCLRNITETNGVITFSIQEDNERQTSVEDFEAMPSTTNKMATDVPGNFAKWSFIQCNVADITDASQGNGQHAAAMVSPSLLRTDSDIEGEIYSISMRINNPTKTTAKFKLYYSTDQGATWSDAPDATQSVEKNETETLTWRLQTSGPVRYRLNMTAGNKNTPCYIDDITLLHLGDLITHMDITGDVNGDGTVDGNDLNLLINIILGNDNAENYGGRANVDGLGGVDGNDLNALINILLGK